MKNFYSVIKLAPNSITDDTLSIGLLLYDGRKYWLQFSEDRKNASKRLMEENSDSVDFITKQITSHVQNLNREIANSSNKLFPLETLLTSEYFEYLNRYSNGLLRFTSPNFLNDQINEEKFDKLFNLLIYSSLVR